MDGSASGKPVAQPERIDSNPSKPAESELTPAVAPGYAVRARFVGRERELARLRAAIDASLGGEPAAMLIEGEAGIGKSRLVQEVCVHARMRGAQVLGGGCDEDEPRAAYLPFVEALRRYVLSRPREPLARELGDGAARVSKLVPEVRSLLGELPVPSDGDPEYERLRLFDSISTFLMNVSRSNPVTLVLEDLHWADASSLQLFKHLVRKIDGGRITILATYRDTDLPPGHALAKLRADLRRERICQWITLAGLDPQEAVALAEALTNQPAAALGSLAQAIHRLTEGNPFFIEEIVRHMVETGRLCDGGLTSDPSLLPDTPASVRDVIGLRLSRLSDQCNRVLSSAAVLGREFEYDVVRQLAGLEEEALVGSLEQALAARVVVEARSHGGPEYAFSHALIRQTLYEELSLPRRQRLHLKAAEAIEATHPHNLERYLATLALHYRMAGSGAAVEKAVDYSVRAGEAAYRVFAYEEAASHWRGAVQLMEEHGIGSERRARVLERLGALMFLSDLENPQGVDYLEQALKLYEGIGRPDRAARVHWRLGSALSFRSWAANIPRAMEHYRQAEAVLSRGAESPYLGHLYNGMAMVALMTISTEEGLAWSRRGIEIAEYLGNDDIRINGTLLLGAHSIRCGKLAEGLEKVDTAAEEELSIAGVRTGCMAAWNSGLIRINLRDPCEAPTYFLRALAKPEIAGALSQRRMFQFLLLRARFEAGELIEPSRIGIDPDDNFRWKSWMLAPWFIARGDWEKAAAAGAEIVEVMHRSGCRDAEWEVLTQLGPLSYLQGNLAQAETLLRKGLDIAIAANGPAIPLEVAARINLALVYGQAGRLDDAVAHLERCREIFAAGEDWRGLAGSLALAEAVVASAKRNFPESEAHFERAVQIFGRYRVPWDEAEALLCWGRALVAASDGPRASEKLDAAIRIYRRIGAGERWVERVLAEWRKVPTSLRTSAPTAARDASEEPETLRTVQPAVVSALFRREGEYWTLAYRDHVCRVKHVQGLSYISFLLGYPGQEFSALYLVGQVRAAPGSAIVSTAIGDQSSGDMAAGPMREKQLQKLGLHGIAGDDAGEMLDERAKAAYRRRLAELKEQLAKVKQSNDVDSGERLQDEIDFLTRELARAVGLGGRARRAGSASERARLTVTRAIRRAVRKIDDHDSTLADLLVKSIRTGTFCAYKPEAAISWTL